MYQNINNNKNSKMNLKSETIKQQCFQYDMIQYDRRI